jgi:uncharacterized membrane protein
MMRAIAVVAALLLSGCGRTADAPQPNGLVQEPPARESAPAPTNLEEPSGPSASNSAGASAASPCLVQDGRPVGAKAIRAVGTEPFWGASVEGRCVTYSTPENQAGVRIWTKFDGTSESGRWSGALDGKPFVMTTKPDPRCSDGMSDKIYPIAVTLSVGGEERRGCAEPR